MKAMVIRQYGGPEVFEMVETDKPELKPGYVLVKVMASSLNPLETKIRSGLAASLGPALPAILNADVAGEIVAVGEGVQWQPGDQVFGCAGGVGTLPGALAEYMLADARLLARKPGNIDYATAALFPLVSITAWEGIMEKSLAQAGGKLLLHGAAGGVGHIALQLAKQQGAVVYATVTTPAQADIARDLGAREESVAGYVDRYTAGQGFDAVFDPVGGDNLANSLQAVKLKGVVCTTNARTTLDISLMHAKALTLQALLMTVPLLYNLERERHGAILEKISRMIEQGKLRIHRDPQQFSFAEIGKAHAYLESRKATGKVSLINSFSN